MHVDQVFIAGVLTNKNPKPLASGMTFDAVTDLADLSDKRIELRIVVSGFTKPDTYCVVICDEKRTIVQESQAIEITEDNIKDKHTTAVVTIVMDVDQPKRGQIRCVRVADLLQRLEKPLISDPTDDVVVTDALADDLRAALSADRDALHKSDTLMQRVAEARQDDVAWVEIAVVLKDFNLLRSTAKKLATWTPADPPRVAPELPAEDEP